MLNVDIQKYILLKIEFDGQTNHELITAKFPKQDLKFMPLPGEIMWFFVQKIVKTAGILHISLEVVEKI